MLLGLRCVSLLLTAASPLHCPLVSAAGIELHHEGVGIACVHMAIQGAARVACHIHVPVRVHLCRRVSAVLFGLATRVRGVLPGTLPEMAISARCLPPSSALSFLSHASLKIWWIEFLHMPCSASHTPRLGSQGLLATSYMSGRSQPETNAGPHKETEDARKLRSSARSHSGFLQRTWRNGASGKFWFLKQS